MVTNYVAVATILILLIVPVKEFFNLLYQYHQICIYLLAIIIISKHLENLVKKLRMELKLHFGLFLK